MSASLATRSTSTTHLKGPGRACLQGNGAGAAMLPPDATDKPPQPAPTPRCAALGDHVVRGRSLGELADVASSAHLPDFSIRLGQDVKLAIAVTSEPKIDAMIACRVFHRHLFALAVKEQEFVYLGQVLAASAHLVRVGVEDSTIDTYSRG